jgi:aminopeptidase-like protein
MKKAFIQLQGKNKLLFAFSLFLTWWVLQAQRTFVLDSAVYKEIYSTMSVLAHDSLRGREGGTIYEQKAASYLIGRLQMMGIPPLPGTDNYLQCFYLDSNNKVVSCNVLAYIDHQAPYTVVIGGHYDHIGFTQKDSILIINNGADDNASGATLVLTLAKTIKEKNLNRYNYVFAFWGSEEKGLIGSSYFCRSQIYPFSKIAFYLNFDMVGSLNWDNSRTIIVFGTGTSTYWDSLALDTVRFGNERFRFKKFRAAVEVSDHACFYKRGVPFLYFTTGLPPRYHTQKDKLSYINFDGMAYLHDFVFSLLQQMDGHKLKYKVCSEDDLLKVYFYFFKEMLKKSKE